MKYHQCIIYMTCIDVKETTRCIMSIALHFEPIEQTKKFRETPVGTRQRLVKVVSRGEPAVTLLLGRDFGRDS